MITPALHVFNFSFVSAGDSSQGSMHSMQELHPKSFNHLTKNTKPQAGAWSQSPVLLSKCEILSPAVHSRFITPGPRSRCKTLEVQGLPCQSGKPDPSSRYMRPCLRRKGGLERELGVKGNLPLFQKTHNCLNHNWLTTLYCSF